VFNILAAWSFPTLIASLRHKPQEYSMSAGVAILVGFTVAILAFVLLAVPLLFGWRLTHKAAIAILLIYALSQILFLVAEEL
jgi:Ca2+/Na+ antiporter